MKTILTLLLATSFSYSQSISKQIIGSGGKTQSNSNLTVSWTTGEPIVGLMTAGGFQLGNGYYPALDVQALSVEDQTLELQIKVYPNPTTQLVYVSHPKLTTFSIQITDLNGKEIHTGKIENEVPLDISSYSNGMYLVTIENSLTNKKNTYKIIKN